MGSVVGVIVSEIFGPTFQGEGPRLGRRCGFVRLMACNLSCTWCDTPYTWDASRYDLKAEGTTMTPTEVVAQFDDMNVNEVVVTGGEPLLHQRRADWTEFITTVSADRYITVETNGTIEPTPVSVEHVDVFSVSPKLAHSGDPWPKRLVPPTLVQFARLSDEYRAYFKFVAEHPDDLAEVGEITRAYDIPTRAVWIMPEGVTAEAITSNLHNVAEATLANGWNLTTRLHVLAWGNTRGV